MWVVGLISVHVSRLSVAPLLRLAAYGTRNAIAVPEGGQGRAVSSLRRLSSAVMAQSFQDLVFMSRFDNDS